MRDPSLRPFLVSHGLEDPAILSALANTTLHACVYQCTTNRTAFLGHLTRLGIEKLGMRQKVANMLCKLVRLGTLPKLSMAETLAALAEADPDGEVVHVPYDVAAQSPPPDDAPKTTRVPRVIMQTSKTTRVGAAAWRNTCTIFEHNPHFSFKFYDDERCEQLIREHFAPCVAVAWSMLRAGAAKADLWRYCALYVHGGVYLDLDACIAGPLDRPSTDTVAEPLVGHSNADAFLYDAEANLIQWVLISSPGHPVLRRTIELSVARILAREPNIFIATGPSVFTDAYIAVHTEREQQRNHGGVASTTPRTQHAMYASRTSMSWSERFDFLQKHKARGEGDGTVRA